MILSQIIKLKTDDGLTIVDFLLEVMQDRYEDFRICHRLQAAKLLTTYGNEDAPDFIEDNPREPQSNRNGRRPKRSTKFDEELARVIKEDTRDRRSVARFLIYVMEGELTAFRPHHRMSAARELLDRGFSESLERRAVTTGMFITTSDFTNVARRAAEKISIGKKPIRLVDGSELARFMASLNMGGKNASVHCAHKPEEDHFDEHT